MDPFRHTHPADLLRRRLATAPATPFLTFYDDDSDVRTELSATTFGNWVAKTANLLQEEFDVAPGSTVAVALPVHWQTAAVLLAVWSCGAAVLDTAAEDDGRLAGADVVLADVARLPALEEALGDDGPPLLGLSLHPMGLGLRDYSGSARDFAIEVRGAADVFVPWQPVDPAATGLLAGGLELSLGGLVATAQELASRLGITAEDRMLVDDLAAAQAGPVAWLLAPLAAGASVVLCRSSRPDRLPRRAAEERVTATLGAVITGVRELGRPG